MTNLPPPPNAPERSQALGPGTVIGGYTILKLLNQSGMGLVYQAEQNRTGRQVALKIISPAALLDPQALERFQRESQTIACLEHPNIVGTLDVDQAGDLHFLVKQYVDGDDLATMVKKRGPLAIDLALRCLMHAAHGLDYLHNAGVIHRDVKPSNLVVGSNGVVKILGMGSARLPESLPEAAGRSIGTTGYVAPEQALDANAADRRSDIYSLGCTFYYLLAGEEVYQCDSQAQVTAAQRSQPIPSLTASRPDIPPGLDATFQKMVAKNRDDRYQSMAEVRTAIDPYGAAW